MWSVSVNGNWRVTFYFENQDAVLVEYRLPLKKEFIYDKKTDSSW